MFFVHLLSEPLFGLFRLLGYRFSPRLADIAYGQLNWIARQRVNLQLIAAHWDDLLRLAGSLKLARVPATGIMRTLQVGDRPTRLAQALTEFGRIDKTLHSLTYIDDENRRRATLTQLAVKAGIVWAGRCSTENGANCGSVTEKARRTS